MKLSYKPSFTILFSLGAAVFMTLLFVGSFHLYQKYDRLSDIEERIVFLQKKQQNRKASQYIEEKILEQIQSCPEQKDLVTSLSIPPFLESQQQKWKMLLAQASSHENSEAFLADNQLHFIEKSSNASTLFEEKEWKQKNVIYASEEDLENIIFSLEGHSHGPQIMVTSFSLEKKNFPQVQERVFAIRMELLTRHKKSCK